MYLQFYLIDTLGLGDKALALVPLTLYVAGLAATFATEQLNDRLGRKLTYLAGGVVVLLSSCGFQWLTEARAVLVYPLAVILVSKRARGNGLHSNLLWDSDAPLSPFSNEHEHDPTPRASKTCSSLAFFYLTQPTNEPRASHRPNNTQGVGSATVMITSHSMANDLVGEHAAAKGGFVYGAFSLTDK